MADRSNEITAMPKLLEMMAIEGATVTIDAMAQRATEALALSLAMSPAHIGLAPNLCVCFNAFLDKKRPPREAAQV